MFQEVLSYVRFRELFASQTMAVILGRIDRPYMSTFVSCALPLTYRDHQIAGCITGCVIVWGDNRRGVELLDDGWSRKLRGSG